ncbi:DNA methyltransferase, partial [Bacteroides ovatus]
MANTNLKEAKAAKNDEFYTQFHDIEIEMNAYLEYDPDVFRGKTVLLPCDDPEWSNFTRYFAAKFDELGLKKLISTSYAPDSKKYKTPYQPSLFEQEAPQFDPSKAQVKGKIFILERDKSGDGRINIDDLEWKYMDGDGDFRSKEVTELRNEADFIITNPPFSLFREFLAWIVEGKKQFAVIGNKNCITYKEVFPLIKNNKMWLGKTPMSVDLLFEVPDTDQLTNGKKLGSGYRIIDGKILARSQSVWLTNIDHGRRHQPLALMSMADNLRFSKHKELKGKTAYDRYDNYDAIEVPFTDAIPSDYDGVMGVPISFLDKYCPEQFEILGITKTWYGSASKVYP